MILGLEAFWELEALQAWEEADESRVQGRARESRTKRKAAETGAVVKGRDASVDSGACPLHGDDSEQDNFIRERVCLKVLFGVRVNELPLPHKIR